MLRGLVLYLDGNYLLQTSLKFEMVKLRGASEDRRKEAKSLGAWKTFLDCFVVVDSYIYIFLYLGRKQLPQNIKKLHLGSCMRIIPDLTQYVLTALSNNSWLEVFPRNKTIYVFIW